MSKRWYVIHTYSGYEKKVKASLEHVIESAGLSDYIFDVVIPTEEVTEIKEGNRSVKAEKKLFPGYVLIRMDLDTDKDMGSRAWSVVRRTQGVTGFVGAEGKPSPLSRDEYMKIMKRTDPKMPKRITTEFTVGQVVKIISGHCEGLDGTISEIRPAAGKLTVMVHMFGHETPAELNIADVQSV